MHELTIELIELKYMIIDEDFCKFWEEKKKVKLTLN